MLLGLIWTLILHYDIRTVHFKGELPRLLAQGVSDSLVHARVSADAFFECGCHDSAVTYSMPMLAHIRIPMVHALLLTIQLAC